MQQQTSRGHETDRLLDGFTAVAGAVLLLHFNIDYCVVTVDSNWQELEVN
jgi:hypothetical protein